MRCNSDGSNVTIIRNVINPMALALDMQNRFVMLFTLYTWMFNLLFKCHFLLLGNGSFVALMLSKDYMFEKYDIDSAWTADFVFIFNKKKITTLYCMIAVYSRFLVHRFIILWQCFRCGQIV